jgi:hypothetical protein
MFFIECKTIPQTCSESTIVYTNNQCVIQFIENGEVNLIEYIIPVLHTDDEKMEVSIVIDEFISKCIKKFFVMKIDSKTVSFDNEINYTFTPGEIITWETRLPKFSCCFRVPRISEFLDEDDSETLNIKVSKDFLILKTENTYSFQYQLLHCYEEYNNTPSFSVNSYFLVRHLKQHENEFCKLYIENDFPMCLEFVKNYTERVYIAPIIEH